MFNSATLIRFAEAFLVTFVVTFAADPLFSGNGADLLGADGIRALGIAAVSAAVLAFRRVLATKP